MYPHPFSPNDANATVALVTPTPGLPDATIEVGPPSGWVAAGLLILLLVIMLYQNLVKVLRRLFKRKNKT